MCLAKSNGNVFCPQINEYAKQWKCISPEKVSTLDKPVAFFEPEPISSCFGDLLFVDGFISESRIDI